MRLFTAIDIPAEISDRLRSARDLHITLKFIGEWPEPSLPQLKEVISAVPKPGPLEITIRGLGNFKKILWAGVDPSPALKTLAANLDTALAKLGVPFEQREFRPHVTLARNSKSGAAFQAAAGLSPGSAEDHHFGSFLATSFFLYLSAAGKYTKLQEYPLV